MSWNAVMPDRMVELVEYWVDQDWPLTPDKVPAVMAGLGWEKGEDGRWQASTIPLFRQSLSATGSNPWYGLNIEAYSWGMSETVKPLVRAQLLAAVNKPLSVAKQTKRGFGDIKLPPCLDDVAHQAVAGWRRRPS